MKYIALLLTVVLALALNCALAEEYKPFPEAVRFSQKTTSEEPRKNVLIYRTVPKTACASVNEEITALVDGMLESRREEFLSERAEICAFLDAGALISWTGDRVMSFVVLCDMSRDTLPLSCDMTTRTYDMTTGDRLMLTDFFAPDSEAWSVMADAVRTQLSAAFPRETPDEAALDALCTQEALELAEFSLGTMRLTLHYPASSVYPGKNTLLHVELRYAPLRAMMTPFGQEQTVNTDYRMVALTFDDGQVRYNTRRVLDELRKHGAQATFFIVGEQMKNNQDNLALEQNRGYSLQSHTYDHHYFYEMSFERFQENERKFAREMSDYVGVAPTMLRAPGGSEKFYEEYDIGFPIMHWSLPAGDSGETRAESVTKRIHWKIIPGDVVLMHETNAEVREYVRDVLADLHEMNYLCVTLEDLYEAYGIELKNNEIYFSPTFVPVD